MIKKILVALDPDTDTPIAIRYAVDIARKHQAEITGLAVVDMGSIESELRGGGIGSMYYAEKLRANLTTEAREKAQSLLDEFYTLVNEAGVKGSKSVEEGVPFKRIIEDAKYHDLLIIGKEPHFFYNHPEERTKTVIHVIKNTIAPAMIVGMEYRPIQRVLITCDNSYASARTLREFVQMKPFGTDITVGILDIYEGDDVKTESEIVLQMVQEYVLSHGFHADLLARSSKYDIEEIVSYTREFQADLLVVGAHSESFLRRLAFRESTETLLKEFPAPLFISS